MKIKRSRYTYGYEQRARKARRRLWLAGLFSVLLLLLCDYGVASLVRHTSMPAAEAVPSPVPPTETLPAQVTPTETVPSPATPTETAPAQATPAEAVPFAWPEVGQAAVGSVEGGLLARSSDHEDLRPTASMAKVITALAVMEKQPFELGQAGQTYTITSEDVARMNAVIEEGGSVLPLLIGAELTQYQALQRVLMASDNATADILVERTFGSQEAYVAYAQAMLQRRGLSRTVVADASGFSPDTVSTPSELVALGIAALQNPVIAEIVAQPQAELPGLGTIRNTNALLGTDGVIGIKTGTTDEAGHCLLMAARYPTADGQAVTLVAVIMGDTDASRLFRDSRQLLASARQGLGLLEAQPGDIMVAPPLQHRDRAPGP